MPENMPQPPLKAADNPPVAREARTASNPGASTVRRGALARHRRKRLFLFLEIFTILFAAMITGFYGNLLGTLAAISFNTGHYSLAGDLSRDALLVQEKVHGSRSLALNEPLDDLAYFYYSTDQMDKAVLMAARSLSICQETLGSRDQGCAWTLSIASLAYDGKGDFVKAEKMANEALPILEATNGKQSWPVASTLNRLGMALDGEGRFPEAETLYAAH
jgi:hypothetical protein